MRTRIPIDVDLLLFINAIPTGVSQLFFSNEWYSGVIAIVAILVYSPISALNAVLASTFGACLGVALGGDASDIHDGLWSYNAWVLTKCWLYKTSCAALCLAWKYIVWQFVFSLRFDACHSLASHREIVHGVMWVCVVSKLFLLDTYHLLIALIVGLWHQWAASFNLWCRNVRAFVIPHGHRRTSVSCCCLVGSSAESRACSICMYTA